MPDQIFPTDAGFPALPPSRSLTVLADNGVTNGDLSVAGILSQIILTDLPAGAVVPGPAGPTGATGAASTVPGPAGPTGAASTVVGPAGVGIASAAINGASHLILTKTDASTTDAGLLPGTAAPAAGVVLSNGAALVPATLSGAFTLTGTTLDVNSTTIAALTDGLTFADTCLIPALNAAGNPVSFTGAELELWIAGHVVDYLFSNVQIGANTLLDRSSHNRKWLICKTPVTISPPISAANFGPGSSCTVFNDPSSTGVITWGAGISAPTPTLAIGARAEVASIFNGTANVIVVSVLAAAVAVPTITINALASQPFVSSTGTNPTIPVTAALANFGSAPTLLYSVDGTAPSLALPAGNSVTSTTASFTIPAHTAGTFTLQLRDSGATAAVASLSITVESASLASVPTGGWTVGSATALTGATTTLTGITTAYAALWDGAAQVGARQAFTSSATLAALSFTPATANSTTTIRAYDAATAGNLLAETAAFTVASSSVAVLAIAPGSQVTVGPYLMYVPTTFTEPNNQFHGSVQTVPGAWQIAIERTTGTGIADATGFDPNGKDPYTAATAPKFTTVTHQFVNGVGGAAFSGAGVISATRQANSGYATVGHPGTGGVVNTATWGTNTYAPGAAGSGVYIKWTTGDGQIVYMGPFTFT